MPAMYLFCVFDDALNATNYFLHLDKIKLNFLTHEFQFCAILKTELENSS